MRRKLVKRDGVYEFIIAARWFDLMRDEGWLWVRRRGVSFDKKQVRVRRLHALVLGGLDKNVALAGLRGREVV